MPGGEECLHHGRQGLVEARGVVGDKRGFNVVDGDLGGDDEAGDVKGCFALTLGRYLVVPRDGEEGGDRLRVAHLEELADLGLVTEILVQIVEDVGHGSGFGGLTGDLAVHDLSAARRVDGLEALSRRGDGEERDEEKNGESEEKLAMTNHEVRPPGVAIGDCEKCGQNHSWLGLYSERLVLCEYRCMRLRG